MIIKFFRWLRVHYKLFKRKFACGCIDSFCKECGIDVRDFDAPDDVWEKVDPHIKHGHVLCYNCFCDYCNKLKLLKGNNVGCWKLTYLEEK